MSVIKELYDIRDYVEDDKSFVMSTFLRGIYYGNTWFEMIPKDIFMNNYKYNVEAIVDNAKTVIKVACMKDSPDVILGYSVVSGDFQTIHFVYVKKAWRKAGVGKSLVPKHPQFASHMTEVGKQLLPKIKPCVFNPFSLG